MIFGYRIELTNQIQKKIKNLIIKWNQRIGNRLGIGM